MKITCLDEIDKFLERIIELRQETSGLIEVIELLKNEQNRELTLEQALNRCPAAKRIYDGYSNLMTGKIELLGRLTRIQTRAQEARDKPIYDKRLAMIIDEMDIIAAGEEQKRK